MSRTALQKRIIDNIRRIRKEKHLTQEELANRCELHTGYIGGIETYGRFPKIDNLDAIARGLGVDIAYLVSEQAEQQAREFAKKIEDLEGLLHQYIASCSIPDYTVQREEKQKRERRQVQH